MSLKQNSVSCHICDLPSHENKRLYFQQYSHDTQTKITICDHCVESLHSYVLSQKSAVEQIKPRAKTLKDFYPKEVYQHLEESIIGQAEVKKAISVAIYQHYQRINNPNMNHKSNILLIGPTGTGKTEVARSVADFLKVPFVQADMTLITPRGYIGESPELVVEKLLNAANGNVAAAEKGIIFLDEFDKIPSGEQYGSFKAKAVQQEILKLIEGDRVEIRVGGEQGRKVSVNTKNILFIAAGSFVGLENIVENENEKSIGLGGQPASPKLNINDLGARVENKHLVGFGLIPEVLGRFPVICFTKELSQEQLIQVLVEPKDSILNYYRKLFATSGVELNLDPDCIAELAEKAFREKIGARGLKRQLEITLQELLFEVDKYKNKVLNLTSQGVIVQDKTPKAKSAGV